jgi:DNA-binding transcriptional MerR regulator
MSKVKKPAAAAERTYTPADLCELFGLSRTTLFRWEEQHEIPKAEREGNNRIYRREHLRSIAGLMRKKIRDEINASSRYNPDELHPTPDQLEKLFRVEFVGERDPVHGLRMLSALAKKHKLSEETVNLLIKSASNSSAGDPMRRKIWELLMEQENIADSEDE